MEAPTASLSTLPPWAGTESSSAASGPIRPAPPGQTPWTPGTPHPFHPSIPRPLTVSVLFSRKAFGITIAGEFSNAINDCGLYVHGVNISAAYGPDCAYWEDASRWSDATRAGLLAFARASMDALGDWFFWTWKVGPAAGSNGEGEGAVRAPLWSYSLGLEGGWIPRDPRDARGACESFGAAPSHPFDGAYAPAQTGSGTAMAVETEDVLAWPPALLHVSGAQAALPGPTAGAGDGATTAGAGAGSGSIGKAFAPIEGCAYPDAWDALGAKVPVGGCT